MPSFFGQNRDVLWVLSPCFSLLLLFSLGTSFHSYIWFAVPTGYSFSHHLLKLKQILRLSFHIFSPWLVLYVLNMASRPFPFSYGHTRSGPASEELATSPLRSEDDSMGFTMSGHYCAQLYRTKFIAHPIPQAHRGWRGWPLPQYIYIYIYIYPWTCRPISIGRRAGPERPVSYIYIHIHIHIIHIYVWRTKVLTTYNGHGQCGWSPIACEGLYFHPVCENRVSVSGWSPIGCEGFRTNLNIPSPLHTTFVFQSLILSVIQYISYIYIYI